MSHTCFHSAFASPKLSIALRENPTSFVVDHTPALPSDVMKGIQMDQAGLSFTHLLSTCVEAHIKSKIQVENRTEMQHDCIPDEACDGRNVALKY